MNQKKREGLPVWATYALALLTVAGAVCIRLMLDPWIGQAAVPYVAFGAAVALSAFLWGRGPGITATIAGGMAADFFICTPRHTLLFDSSIEMVPMGFFILAGLLVSILAGRLRASGKLAEERAQSLRLRAEELQRERSLLTAITQATDVMLVYLDPDFNFVSVNEAYAQTCAMRPEEMIGKNHFALYPHEENEAIFRHVRETGVGVFYKDKPFEFPDQPERGVTYWDWSLAPVKDGGGRVTGLVFSLRETTRYKQAEEALRRSEALLARAEKVANLGSWGWDIGTGELSWSEQVYSIFGLKSGELTPSYESFLALVNPEDRDTAKRAVDEALAGRPYSAEWHITRPDSSVRRILFQGDVDLDAAGKPIRMVGTTLDITERDWAEKELRRTNERLSLLLSALPVGVTIAEDAECRVITANAAGASMFDASDGTNVSASSSEHPAHRYFHLGRELRPEEMPMQMAVLGNREIQDMEIEARLASGRRWTGLTSASPLHDRDGRVIGGIAVVRDITERKRMEEALAAAKVSAERAKAVAEAASLAKDHFLAVLSHELRNPLNPVLATASMLRRDPRFDAETQEQLEIICRNAEMEARLIDDLLDVTRIERGKIELDRRPCDLATILRRAIEVCMPDIKARNLEFGVDLGPAPYLVEGDAARLQQVFWNLIKNAIKFTPAGGSVSVRCRPGGDGFVLAEVKDSGEGIEPDALGFIFNAFEQAERSITRQFGGLGLGLTISKALVEMHGGSIRARSEGKGKGATFTVGLPLLPLGAAGLSFSTMAAPTAAPARPARILLVEDHGDTARIMQVLLAADGHQVQTAADVATALKLVQETTFDLLLSDLGLPDGSGLDLIRAIRAKGIDLPAIALSGFGQEKDVQQSRDAGFLEHVTKPISFLGLEETIARVMGDRTRGARS